MPGGRGVGAGAGGGGEGGVILRRCQPSESLNLRDWIISNHYTHAAPPGFRVALEFIEDASRVGGMLLGIPNARELPCPPWLELTRMYFTDAMPKNTESQGLGMMRRWVRKWLPDIRMLIAYSNPAAGHTGTVYAADGWGKFGETRARHEGWENRPGRRGEVGYTPKARWLRTP